MKEYDNHRCEGSLKARCSIRRLDGRETPSRRTFMRADGQWHLYEQITDWDYDVTYMSEVARVRYCPWCGKEL